MNRPLLRFTVFVHSFTTVIVALLCCWWIYKLLKNIYDDSLFVYENVWIFLKLGITIGILGSVPMFLENRILQEVLPQLTITNADVTYATPSFVETILSGFFLILIALSLRTAVKAVEENKKTI